MSDRTIHDCRFARRWFVIGLVVANGVAARPDPASHAIEEVVVTATKRDVALQDLPLSVGVLSARDLIESGALRIEDYWRSIPSVNIKDGALGGNNVIIRGLNDTDSFQQNESLTAFYHDDTPVVYLGGLFATPGELALVDVERVEVLRGPQGTLIGANAMGGAVRVISNLPDPDRREVNLIGQLSTTAHGGEAYEFTAVLNQPLESGRSALRAVAYYHDDDGFIDDVGLIRPDVNGEQLSGFRAALSFTVGDHLEVIARGQVQRRGVDGFDYVNSVGRPAAGIFTSGDYETALFVDEGRDEDIGMASLNVSWQGNGWEFVSATSWFEKEVDLAFDFTPELILFFGLPFPAPGTDARRQEDLAQEFRIASTGEGDVTWLAGVFYLDQDLETKDQVSVAGIGGLCPPVCFPFPGGRELILDTEGTKSRQDLAVFGEITWRLQDRWSVSLGGRWFDMELSQADRQLGGLIPVSQEPVKGSSDGFIGKASLSWDLSEETMVYGLVSQGFRPGQLNTGGAIAACGAEPVLESDHLVNYEVGARFRSEDGRSNINATAYYMDWSGIQISGFPPECMFISLDNSGKATSKGLEFEWVQIINDRLDLRAAIGYTDATLEEASALLNARAGARIPNVPRVTGSLSGTVRFPVFGGLDGFARFDAQFVGSQKNQFNQAFDTELPSYGLLNLRAGVDTGKARVEWFMDNLFDEEAAIFCCRLLPEDNEPALSRPRTTGIRAIYRF